MLHTGQVLHTSRFGALTTFDAYRFTRPILGFEQYSQFALLPEVSGFPQENPLLWLQSVESAELAFVLTRPELFALSFALELPDDCLKDLGLDPANAKECDIHVYTMVTLPADDPEAATTNLMAPLLFVPATGLAMQWVNSNGSYSTKTPLVTGA
jgi:flagellar assembly factor FliW